jgi:hypothetical protein
VKKIIILKKWASEILHDNLKIMQFGLNIHLTESWWFLPTFHGQLPFSSAIHEFPLSKSTTEVFFSRRTSARKRSSYALGKEFRP